MERVDAMAGGGIRRELGGRDTVSLFCALPMEGGEVRVLWDGAVCIEEMGRRLYLDPRRRREAAVVTHAHLDHAIEGALMTHQTRDVMATRTLKSGFASRPLRYGELAEVGGFEVTLSEAGHVLGSAMVRTGDLLYTGDFNTSTGITCGAASPQRCRTLVVEATYGDPRFVLPEQEQVVSDIIGWLEDGLESGPVVLGAYEFGKAQDLVALANSLGAPVVVEDGIAPICEVYRKHGVPLDFTPLSIADPEVLRGPHVLVVPRRELRRPLSGHVRALRERGARTAYFSGWAAFWDFTGTYDIDAQFPLSNHADFRRLIDFVEACTPSAVYTVHGAASSLAAEITRRLGIRAEPLG
ncbi:MAG: hypothetical protein QXH42_07615 [Thermoplasmata archaeon]